MGKVCIFVGFLTYVCMYVYHDARAVHTMYCTVRIILFSKTSRPELELTHPPFQWILPPPRIKVAAVRC
jgi:hypothetical protein